MEGVEIVENWSNWIVSILSATLAFVSGYLLHRFRTGDERHEKAGAAEIEARVKFTDQLMRRIDQMHGDIGDLVKRMDDIEKSEQDCLERERALRRRIEELERRTNGH